MNEIISGITGGYPVSIDMLDYMQQNTRIQTVQMAKALSLGEDSLILWGAEFTIYDEGTATPTLDISEGAIFYLDEVYLIDAVVGQTLPSVMTSTGLTTMEWDLDETIFHPLTFKDGNSNDVLSSKKSILKNPGVGTWLLHDVSRYDVPVDEDWITPTFIGEFVHGGSSNTMRYRKLINGDVQIAGFAQTGGVTDDDIFILPVGYRPIEDLFFSILTDSDAGIVSIRTNGLVELYNNFISAGINIILTTT